MLGVTRIYGRQAQYLLDDCRDTRERITAFVPGIVDLPEDQARAPNAAITLPQLSEATIAMSAMDLYDWASVVPVSEPQGLHMAPLTRTNLRASREYGAYNFGRPAALSIYGGSAMSRSASVEDVTSKLESNELFAPFDLGLDTFDATAFETDPLDHSMEMEMGRDHFSAGRGSSPIQGPPDFQPQHEIGGEGDWSMAPIDLDLDMPDLPALDASSNPNRSSSPASSALSTPPPESPPTMPVSPVTAKRLAAAGGRPRVKRVRVMRPDEALELPDEVFADSDEAEFLVVPRYIPRSDDLVHMREMASDADHFLPMTHEDDGKRSFYAGPRDPDLAPGLAELFSFPAHVLRRPASELEREDRDSSKRPRLEEGDFAGFGEIDLDIADFDLETGRRHSRSRTRTPALGGERYDSLDLPEYDPDMTFDPVSPFQNRSMSRLYSRAPSLAPSRAESIARAIQEAEDLSHPLAIFDGGESSQMGSEVSERSAGGFSKTTGMAMGVLRREIEAIESGLRARPEETTGPEEQGGKPSVQFADVARGASKRAASQFFFELLVLGTRDAVSLKQDAPYGPIAVEGKPKLWEKPGSASATSALTSPPGSEL